MKRSKIVTLGSVGALAAAFSACADEEETAYCVDENEQVVENRYCDEDRGGGGGFIWFFGAAGLVGGDSVRGRAGDRVRASDQGALARRGGFGSTGGSAGGIGRPVGGSGGG